MTTFHVWQPYTHFLCAGVHYNCTRHDNIQSVTVTVIWNYLDSKLNVDERSIKTADKRLVVCQFIWMFCQLFYTYEIHRDF